LQVPANYHGETRAPSVGSLPGSMMVDAGGYCRSPECEKPVPDEARTMPESDGFFDAAGPFA
jgi:hypothetical protein